ncbi:MAG: hypothetical protein JGK24_09770 [Microcoleus sp. PH2017_29_MFU_D_A]|nr:MULTISPECIES: hypothetical protein [unclassified Microcoleus]MCC3418333.1 hypothetical protein [Microcoleus sp. PH2017_07_MST_O_A]MCC3429124.1 hypothetical protein [Microcoleus sp. PH2017_04_SCI_O_A]MCC3442738.1 hypothetical protein [Microcoleus sp. PH2017_03_ELD_O_A]MCC3503743.1 hypothetical protein [Microcoleus sp. PH2017_19_SFW_U_A]MCC3511453.1 hypothetical protein [Microcoleus sp. PH2017_17_BER_D_A]
MSIKGGTRQPITHYPSPITHDRSHITHYQSVPHSPDDGCICAIAFVVGS